MRIYKIVRILITPSLIITIYKDIEFFFCQFASIVNFSEIAHVHLCAIFQTIKSVGYKQEIITTCIVSN